MSDFLTKIKKTLGTGVAVIGSTSRELWDAALIRARIAELRSRRRAYVEQLGNLLYSMLEDGNLDLEALRAKAADISGVDQEIRRAEEDLRHVREHAGAPHSSRRHEQEDEPPEQTEHAERPSAEPEVETQLEPGLDPEASTGRRCQCGAEVLPDARYCVQCGRPIPPDHIDQAR